MSIETVWSRLADIRKMTFAASSSAATGWNGKGKGDVDVLKPESDSIVFHESGFWTPTGGQKLWFSNVFRWTLQVEASTIRLEHLRLGSDNPVYLFDLGEQDEGGMASVTPHV